MSATEIVIHEFYMREAHTARVLYVRGVPTIVMAAKAAIHAGHHDLFFEAT